MSGSGRRNYRARYAETAEDLRRAQALRWRCFRAGKAEGTGHGLDGDDFDSASRHVLVEDEAGRLVCTFRLLGFADGSEIAGSYSAQFYGLGRLAGFRGTMLEMGRFCIESEAMDPAILRVAWGALSGHVEAHGAEFIFGCSNFAGTEAAAYADAFALLRARHLAPRRWLPRVKAPQVFRFAKALRLRAPDLGAAMRAMPPLLRAYIAMGGWVSDHAVLDRDLGTLHVFTGLEVRLVPPARLAFVRAAAH